MIQTETCSCGATFSVTDRYIAVVNNAVREWRANHQHGQPVAGEVLESDGPDLAAVITMLESVAERVAYSGRAVVARLDQLDESLVSAIKAKR